MRTSLAVALSCAALIAGGSVLPASAQAVSGATVGEAASLVPAGTVRVNPIALNGFRSFARTGNTLWSENGDVVPLSISGTVLSRVPDLPSSVGIATNSDGSVLYSASWGPNRITVVDPTTRTIKTSFPAFSCPMYMAQSGTRLFYTFSYSCNPSHGGLAALDLDTGQSTMVLATTAGGAAVAVGGSTLVVQNYRTLTTYAMAGADLTRLAERSLDNHKFALSPDGTQLLVADADSTGKVTIHRLATSTLATQRTFTPVSHVGASPVSGVTSLAWSSDGARYAVGLDVTGAGDALHVRDSRSDALIARSVWPGATYLQSHSVGHLVFDRDKPLLRGVGASSSLALVTASTEPGVLPGVTVTVTSPSAYGKTLHAEIRTARCVPCTLRLTLKDSLAETRTFTRTVSGARLSLDLAVKGNGKLTVTLPAALNRIQVTRKRSYVVPARAKVTLTGSYTLKDGTAVYSGSRPTTLVVVSPGRKAPVRETVQWQSDGGTWFTYKSRVLHTGANGRLRTTPPVTRDTRYRIVYRVIGDEFNAESPSAITRVLLWK